MSRHNSQALEKKRGRPRKTVADARVHHIGLRVTAEEQARLRQEALLSGVSVSELILRRALHGIQTYAAPANDTGPIGEAPLSAQRDPLLFNLVRQLRSVGVNLNQIARHTNTTGRLPMGPAGHELTELRTLLLSIERQLDRLL